MNQQSPLCNLHQLPRIDLTAIRAKVIHNCVVAVGGLDDFAWCSGDFDFGAVRDEVVGVW
jgi:hypothetical protein